MPSVSNLDEQDVIEAAIALDPVRLTQLREYAQRLVEEQADEESA